MYYLDIYGQPIQFTYKKSAVYGTICGLIVSFIVVVVILVYIILYCIDIANMEMPTVLNVPEYSNPPSYYEFFPDLNGLTKNATLPDLYQNSNTQGYLQLMIGIHDRTTWVKINNKQIIIEAVNITDNVEYPLFIDNCKRMPFVDEASFERYKLSKVYCIYSPFHLEGDSISNSKHSSIEIRIRKCQKNEDSGMCFVERKLGQLQSYINLKKETGITLDELLTNEVYVERRDSTDSDCNTAIQCDSGDLSATISELDVYLLYVNTIFNQTSKDLPIIRYIDWKSLELTDTINAQALVYFQINKLTSFTNIMPKSMTSSNESQTYVSFDEDKYMTSPSNMDGNDKIISLITIQSSDNKNNYERTYQNLFDILGKIGGFSKIILLIGSVFVFYTAKIRLRESLINDFYSVVDPGNTLKVTKDFNIFLQEIKDGAYEYSLDESVAKNERILCQFYLKDDFVSRLLIVQTKINKNQIEASEKAEYNIARIVYQLYINVIYSGLHFNTSEILANIFCFCCLTKKLREKNIVFRKAVKSLEKDTDFLSILGCVQNFETIKATFLKKETQLSLFKALANKPFASSTISRQIQGKRRGVKEEDEEENARDRINIETLFNNLQELTKDEKKTMEDLKWDEKLVSNLVEDKHKESADNLINNMKEIIQEREDRKQMNNQKQDKAQKLALTKEDYDKIHKKFE